MPSLTNRPMRLLSVEFDELCARHLCRHSQVGVNVVHLIALFALWYAIYGLLFWLTGIEWVLAIPALAYVAVVAPNLPVRVFAVTVSFLGLIVATALLLPAPWWGYLVIIPASYKLQAWSHKIYTIERDMTEFNKKYTKGSVLFVVLLIYEVPIVLNVLFFLRTQIEPSGVPVTESPQPALHSALLAGDHQETAGAKAS